MWIWIVKPFHYGLQTFFSAIPIVMDLITKVHNQSPVLRCVFCVRDFFCEYIAFIDKNIYKGKNHVLSYRRRGRRDLGWRRSPFWQSLFQHYNEMFLSRKIFFVLNDTKGSKIEHAQFFVWLLDFFVLI